MALTAGAQEKALFDYSVTYEDGQVVSTANAKLTLGNDMKAWKTGASKIAADGYLSEFGQTVTVTNDDGDQVEQFSVVTVTGSNNPKDQAASGKGSGINCADGKTSARLPQNGSYYLFNPTTDGKVQIGIVLNAEKAFYLIDATEAVATEDGYLEVALPDANLHNYVIKDATGNEVALADDGDAKGGKVSSEKITGTLEFDVVGGKTYYFFCSGSKLGCFGYIFTPAGGATPQVGEWFELVRNGDAEGSDGSCLVCKNGADPNTLFFNVVEGEGVDGSKCVAVTSAVGAANDWDAQFFIYIPDYVFKLGDQYKVSFMAKASIPVELPGPQAHTTPGNYIGWYIDGSSAVNLTTEWQEVSFSGTVNNSMEQYGGVMNGMSTLAYTLNTDKTQSITYYFDNVSWQVLVSEGIEEAVATKSVMNNVRYNLAGQRVDDSFKGVVIMNGRKFIQK